MNYLTKNRGISGKGLQRIAREIKLSKQSGVDDRFELLEMLRMNMDDSDILEELIRAMSDDEAKENLEYIIQMHDLGSVMGSKKSPRRRKAQEWTAMDEFTTSYAETALWSTIDMNEKGDMGESLDENYGLEDLAPETVKAFMEDCKDFQEANADLLERAYEATGNDEAQAGHDFWLTRNGHGAGFWDGDWGEFGDELTQMSEPRGEVNLYVGDDGKIYS